MKNWISIFAGKLESNVQIYIAFFLFLRHISEKTADSQIAWSTKKSYRLFEILRTLIERLNPSEISYCNRVLKNFSIFLVIVWGKVSDDFTKKSWTLSCNSTVTGTRNLIFRGSFSRVAELRKIEKGTPLTLYSIQHCQLGDDDSCNKGSRNVLSGKSTSPLYKRWKKGRCLTSVNTTRDFRNWLWN